MTLIIAHFDEILCINSQINLYFSFQFYYHILVRALSFDMDLQQSETMIILNDV